MGKTVFRHKSIIFYRIIYSLFFFIEQDKNSNKERKKTTNASIPVEEDKSTKKPLNRKGEPKQSTNRNSTGGNFKQNQSNRNYNHKSESNDTRQVKQNNNRNNSYRSQPNSGAVNSGAVNSGAVNKNSRVNSNKGTSFPKSEIPQGHEPKLSPNINVFWDRLSVRVENYKAGSFTLDLNDQVSLSEWIQCWRAAGTGANGNVSALAKSLLLLPAICKWIPPSDCVMNVLVQLLSSKGKISVNVLEYIVNIVRDRLAMDEVLATVTNVSELLAITDKLKQQYSTAIRRVFENAKDNEFQIISVLLSRASDIESYRKKLQLCSSKTPFINSQNDDSLNENIQPWLGWRDKPTVGWFLSTSWLVVPELQSSYQDYKEYSETLLRMWTLLTFYWGAAALWPKCLHKYNGNDKLCGEPLMVYTSHGTCTQRISSSSRCNAHASWRCLRHDHDSICNRCLHSQQLTLIGSPSLSASTDVYDGVVIRETTRRDGYIFLIASIKSRKPPRIDPNWKTSYRLKVSGLVGIVRLGSNGEALSRDHRVQFGEIVTFDLHDKFDDDWRSRSKGNMAVRLIGKGDIVSLPIDADYPLEINERIAIIDFRVFVPEVISVLSTFAQDKFSSHLSEIPFASKLIGQQVSNDSNYEYARNLQHFMKSSQHRELIEYAINTSKIETLKLLKQTERDLIIEKIYRLKQVKSLYGTQLEAFAMGLSSALHCTQGPPGLNIL